MLACQRWGRWSRNRRRRRSRGPRRCRRRRRSRPRRPSGVHRRGGRALRTSPHELALLLAALCLPLLLNVIITGSVNLAIICNVFQKMICTVINLRFCSSTNLLPYALVILHLLAHRLVGHPLALALRRQHATLSGSGGGIVAGSRRFCWRRRRRRWR